MAALALGLIALGIAAVIGAVAAYEALKNSRTDANCNFSNNPVGSPSVGCAAHSIPAVSQKQADHLFRDMAADANDIPFDYPNDCCYSRAHEMCRQMETQGVSCGKVWNYQNPGPPPGHPLRVTTPNTPSGQVTWRYHVAPVVNVQRSDGTQQLEVIDPSMFDHPVKVDEWKRAQNAPDAITQYTDSTPYYRNIDGAGLVTDPDYSQAREQMALHMIERDSQDPGFVSALAQNREQRVRANAY